MPMEAFDEPSTPEGWFEDGDDDFAIAICVTCKGDGYIAPGPCPADCCTERCPTCKGYAYLNEIPARRTCEDCGDTWELAEGDFGSHECPLCRAFTCVLYPQTLPYTWYGYDLDRMYPGILDRAREMIRRPA